MTQDNLIEAAQSWLDLSGESIDADAIELLSSGRDTTVCRFDSASGTVIAKRCRVTTAALEQMIYEHMSNYPRVSTLRFHGVLRCGERDYAWLFVDDAAGIAYDPRDPGHRAIAAEWLAQLHAHVAKPGGRCTLPRKRPADYRELLVEVRKTLVVLKTSAVTDVDQLAIINAVADHCSRLESSWKTIEQACSTLPESLVHGDIVTHNARIRETPTGRELVLFDWEKSGWGTPAEDLSDVDLPVYIDTSGRLGLRISCPALQRLAGAGKAFRCLVFLQWLGPDLIAHSAAAYEQLDLCRTWLDQINREQPWQP
jgi:hypothetical protein